MIATTPTISSAEQPLERSLIGFAIPWVTGPYASAFAMRDLGFKRVLFLVHRNQIVKQAKKSFERVFGNTRTMGIVSGESRDFDKDYIFATIQTMSKEK